MFDDLTLDDVFYRLFRLRRLLLVAALAPLLPLAMAIFAGVWVGWWLWLLWVIAVVAHGVFFPNAWMDLLAISVSFALVLFFSTVGGAMGLGPVLGTLAGLVAWFVLWMGLTTVLPLLDRFAFPVEGIAYQTRLPVDAGTAKSALFIRPDTMVGYHDCGPLEAEGVFSVTPRFGSDFTGVAEGFVQGFSEDDHDAQEPFSFLAKVVSRDETSQETVFIVDFSRDEMEVVTTHQFVEQTAKGCLYQKIESGHGMGLFTGAGFWLNDVDGDGVRAALDAQLEQPTPALRSATRDSLLFCLARFMSKREKTGVKA
ncbi:MAG: hypothetical protein ACRBCL_10235 [Maritimibacter sp.]